MKRNADKGLVVLAVTDEDKHVVEEFIRNTGLDVPAYRDPDGDAFRAFQIMALPTIVVIDREGNVVANLPQLQPKETIEDALRNAGLEL
jgi:peroxiredoxin